MPPAITSDGSENWPVEVTSGSHRTLIKFLLLLFYLRVTCGLHT